MQLDENVYWNDLRLFGIFTPLHCKWFYCTWLPSFSSYVA